MNAQRVVSILFTFALGMTTASFAATAPATARGPVELRVDNLANPLGIDDATPRFSWQLRDALRGAKQTAYQIMVASSSANLSAGKADIWDSGRISSPEAINIRYAGPALKASTRYYWRVKLWGDKDRAYTPSTAAWWETGLLSQDAWQAQWVGWETPEESMVRNAPAEWIASPDAAKAATEKEPEQRFAFRTTVHLDKQIRHATLYAACRDTVSAWINGEQVLQANPLPPYKQMPWKKYVRADVTKQLQPGDVAVAVECVHYVVNPNGMATEDAPPMSATLYVEYNDGTNDSFVSNTAWRSSIRERTGWQDKGFKDEHWKHATSWQQPTGPDAEPLGHPWIPDSVKLLRLAFDVAKPIKSARLYSTALGAYEMFLNGKRVSEDLLSPGWTDYRERVVYQTYDVTPLLTSGSNAIGALLAPGWYATPLEWFQQPNNYGDTPPALRAQLRIEHTDGTVDWVLTSPDWLGQTSQILSSEIYDGETQDARLIQPGWNTPQFDATHWPRTHVIDPKSVDILAQDFQPIRTERTVSPKSVSQPKPGVYVFDFGQNLAGVERVRLHGPAGTDVKLRFSEILNDDGTLYIDNLRTAKVTDHFILAGKGIEEFTPQFTFHGFRYAEITGLPSAPAKDAISALVIHTDAPFDVKLRTGNTMINKLWSNILWGQRSNFVGVPTDCPQRDERLGWTADAQVFWRTASYNMSLAPFSRKYSTDIRGTQSGTPIYGIFAPGTVQSRSGSGAGWSDAGVIIPWTSWLQTGDTLVIEQNWDAMTKYLNAIESANSDGLWKVDSGTPFGDWLSPEGKTDQVLIATAYWAYDVTLMRQMAHATGRKAEEQKYTELFDKIRTAFQKQFVHSDGFVAGADNTPSPFGQINNPNAKSKGGDTQTGYVLALHMNLLPDNLREAAVNKLIAKIDANNGLLSTGFLGTPYLLEELTKAGHADEAYHLLLNTKYPSWGYLIEHGATTMWERWNGDQMKDDPSMNSYNHYAYGAVADWIYRYAAGIDASPLDAGFHTVVIHPVFDSRLGSINFDYESVYGSIHSSWTVQGRTATWHLTLPANTTGLLSDPDAAKYKLDGVAVTDRKLAKASSSDGNSGYVLQPGTYTFTVSLK